MAYFFVQSFGDNNSCRNNESLATGVWTITCTAKVAGSSYFYIVIYANGRTYQSNTVNVTIASAPVSTIKSNFPRDLTIGSIGTDVKQLQTLLVTEVGYAADLITGYFGSITSNAVKKLQEKYGITPMSGYFGELTRKALTASVSNW